MNTIQIFQSIIKIIIPIVILLIGRHVVVNINPVTKCDNIIRIIVFVFIMAFLAIIEFALLYK